MERLRILAIAPTSFFADYGCHVRIWGHLSALVRRGHRVRLITYPSGRDRPPLEIRRLPLLRGWPIQVGSSWKKVVLDALLVPLVLGEGMRFRPHLVHAFLHEGVALALPLKWARVPVVFDYQGSLTAEMLTHGFLSPRSPLQAFWRGLEIFLDRQADVILTSTAHAQHALRARGHIPEERLILLPDSVDPEVFRPPQPEDAPRLEALRRRWRIPAERPVIAYLGLLAPYQGVDVLLHAFRALVSRWEGEDRPLLLLMGYPFVDRYRAQAQALGLEGDVRLTGPVPYDQAPDYLRLARIATAPKRPLSEGAGKLLPYMATALPVVATDTPAHRAYLGEEGYYARPDDPQDLARALAEALHDPRARERGQQLRARVREQFTWEHAATRIERAYEYVVRQ
ncbi:MAG: glycosyltransferase family 4 protein [Chloroflexi bacterium]|nr:glycosyltransferase family 4 protein [Chloroflexota bacterium]